MSKPTWLSMRAKKAWNAAAGAATAFVSAPIIADGASTLVDKPLGWWLGGLGVTVAAFIATYNAPNNVADPADPSVPVA